MLRATLIVAVLTLNAITVSADPCTTSQSGFDAVQQLEEVAATFPKAPKKMSFPDYAQCLPRLRERKLIKRALAACDLILQIDADQRACIDTAATQGERTLGKVDVVASIASRPIDPMKLYRGYGGVDGTIDPTLAFLAGFHHTPAAAKIIEAWKTTAPNAAKFKPASNQAYVWTEWRKLAVRALWSLGGKPEKVFLEQVIAKETDKDLKELMERVIDHLDP